MAISSPLSSLESTTKDSSKKTIAISRVLSRNIETKRNLSASKNLFRRRRIEFGKRSSLRDRFLVPDIVTRPKGPRSLALADTSTSVTGRLLGFIGYLSAGWILSNMPTWIALGKQFSSRLSIAGGILRNYGDESVRAMNDLANVFGAALENISRFDFTDSSYLVRSSLDDLKTELDSLGVGLSEAFAVLLKPFKDIPKLGTIQPDEPTPTPTPTPTPPEGTGGGGKWKPLLDIIASGEGGYTSIYPSDQNPNLTKMTIAEANRAVGVKGGRGAIGRYQFTSPINQAKSAGLNPDKDLFSPENQDKMAVAIIEKKRGGRDWLSGKITDEQFGYQLAREFAGLKQPNGVGFYDRDGRNTATVNWKDTKSALRKVKTQTSTNISSPANFLSNLESPANAILGMLGLSSNKPGQSQVTGQRRLQSRDVFTKSLGKDVDYILIGDLYGSRGGKHGGIDIQVPYGTYIALRADCEVVAQGSYGNYGILIDVWVPSLGVQLRMTHLSSVIIKSGKIPAGTSFARVGSTGNATGPHIHFEYDTIKNSRRPGGAGNPEAYIRLLLLTKNPNKGKFSPAAVPSIPLVPGTPSISTETEDQVEMETNSYLAGLLNGITQERQGRKIVVIDDRGSAITQQVISSGGDDIQIQIPESVLLNNFIKHKLLLDLNYT